MEDGKTGEAESEKVNKCAERWAEYKVWAATPGAILSVQS